MFSHFVVFQSYDVEPSLPIQKAHRFGWTMFLYMQGTVILIQSNQI